MLELIYLIIYILFICRCAVFGENNLGLIRIIWEKIIKNNIRGSGNENSKRITKA